MDCPSSCFRLFLCFCIWPTQICIRQTRRFSFWYYHFVHTYTTCSNRNGTIWILFPYGRIRRFKTIKKTIAISFYCKEIAIFTTYLLTFVKATKPMKKRHEQKFLIVSLLLFLAVNFPLLLLFDSSDSLAGLPIIYIYLFMVWLFSIIMSFILIKKYDE